MNKDELEGLARATSVWLAYRHLTGLEKSLYEALLIVPIAEFLTANTSWRLETELSYRKLLADDRLPNIYGDLIAIRKGGKERFLLETKYLREKARNRIGEIEGDIIRLSIPHGKLKRYLMIAGPSVLFPLEHTSTTRLFDKLFKATDRKGFDLNLTDRGSNLRPELAAFVGRTGPTNRIEVSGSPKFSYVRHCVSQTIDAGAGCCFRTTIWSVARESAGS